MGVCYCWVTHFYSSPRLVPEPPQHDQTVENVLITKHVYLRLELLCFYLRTISTSESMLGHGVTLQTACRCLVMPLNAEVRSDGHRNA